MRQYNQLAMDQRYQMYVFRKVGYTKNQIAMEIGVHRSTLWREIQRNSGLRGYRPEQAQKFADKRRILAKRPIKMTFELQKIICEYIQLDWSPEQISGYLKLHYQISISHERIYQFILTDKKNGGILYKHLRTKKKYKKRYGSSDKRGTIPDRVSIDERPDIVMQKVRVGDWEGDTIIGKNHKGALVTLVERKTKFTLIAKVERKSADSVTEAIEYLFEPLKKYVFTLTVDNGK